MWLVEQYIKESNNRYFVKAPDDACGFRFFESRKGAIAFDLSNGGNGIIINCEQGTGEKLAKS